jgi:hypothetical protein
MTSLGPSSGGTFTPLAALSPLSRNAGEGGPSPPGWVGESIDAGL